MSYFTEFILYIILCG